MAGFLKSFNIDLTIQVFSQNIFFFPFLVPQGHSCHFSLETSSFFFAKIVEFFRGIAFFFCVFVFFFVTNIRPFIFFWMKSQSSGEKKKL